MSTETTITCDRCKKKHKRWESISHLYYGGRRSKRDPDRYCDRDEMEFDLCITCAKEVCAAIYKTMGAGQ